MFSEGSSKAFAIVILATTTTISCRQTHSSDAADASSDATTTATTTASKRSSDVTFVVADTHFGFGGVVAAHDVLIPALNGIAGHPYPTSIGGVVAKPRGLLITGDLTEWGKPDEWAPFAATYGLDGGVSGKLQMPVFEVEGNHVRRLLRLGCRSLGRRVQKTHFNEALGRKS